MSIYTVLSNRRQKRIDNLITLYTFRHQANLNEARRYVREEPLAAASLADAKVRRVCSSFGFAGTLIRHHNVERNMFFDYWRIPLLALEKPLSTLADKTTGENVAVKDYYKDFWWLISEIRTRRG